MADDYRNTYDGTGTLGSLSPGGSATGALEIANDQDIFAISLVAGRTYTFTLQGASSGFGLSDPSFYLRDASGSAIGFSSDLDGASTDNQLVFTARANGTYYIDAFGSGTGSYRVLADAGFVDDYRDTYNDTNEALGSLTPGGTKTGTLEIANDQDIFAITLEAGRTYTVTLQGASSGFGLSDPSFYLRDANGSAVGFSSDLDGASTDNQLVFTARTSGTYYVDAFGSGTGSYRVLADAGFVDDYRDTYNDTNEALGSLTPGGTKTGTLEVANDQDILAITLEAGRTYTFTMQGASSGFGLSDPSFYLRDANGSAVGFSSDVDGPSTDNQLVFTVNTTGTYYIDAFGNGTGSYRVSANASFVDDYRDTYADTNEALGNLSPGGSATGTIEIANDQDIFAISLVAGRTYTVDMQGASSGFGLSDPSFYLRDANGNAVGFSSDLDGASTDNQLVFTARASGTYYVDAFGDGTGTYRVLANAGFVDDYRDTYNDTIEALGSLTPGGTKTGTIEIANDQDIFAISLVAGQTYTFDMQGASSGFTLDDPSFYLRDAEGTAVGFSSDVAGASTDNQLVFTVGTSGTYYIDAFGGGTGTYRLVASPGTGSSDDYRDTYNGTSGPLGSLSAGQRKTGQIGVAGDKDVFAITLTAGQTYSFDLTSTANGGVALDNAYLRLLNSSGTQVFVNDNFNTSNARLTYKALSTGTFYLEASSATATGTGNYALSAKTGFDDYRGTYNGTGTLGTLSSNGSRYGTIEVGADKDVFAITLTAGQTYSFDLASTTNGGASLSNAYLRLLNSSGTQVLVNDNYNSLNAHLTFKATVSGTYYLEAGNATSSGTGNYLLSSKTGFDDYRGTYNGTGTLGSLAVNGSFYGTVEKAGDKDIFAITLTAGETYSFDLSRTANGGVALDDAYLRLLNSSGTQVLVNDDFNTSNAHLTFKATVSGTYYLEAGSVTSSGTGNYLLSAKTGFDDYRGTYNGTGTLGSLAVNGSLYGTVEAAGDKDVLAVSLTAGESYTFDVAGSTTGGAALSNTFLTLYNSSGTLLQANNDFNSSASRVVYTATATGVYYLEIKSATSTGTGNYLISAKKGFDDHADTITDPASPLGILTIGQNRMGTIETIGDSDVFRFDLVAGHTYSLKATGGSTAGLLKDGELHLLNSAGTIIAHNDDANGTLNPEIVFTAATSGTHYLEIEGVKSATGSYQLGVFDLA